MAGRRVAGPPPTLDAAWVPVVRALRARGGALATVRGPLVLGGRSAGARVACRTAAVLGADAVLCLSFPLHLPGYADRPDKSRAPELRLVTDAGLPIASVQGENDPFGTAGRARRIPARRRGVPRDRLAHHPAGRAPRGGRGRRPALHRTSVIADRLAARKSARAGNGPAIRQR